MLTRLQFIEQVAPIAVSVTDGTGVFPQTLISQSIVESQKQIDGIYYPGESQLAKKYNNYFGIKASNNNTGDSVILNTREVNASGQSYYVDAKFRAYNSLKESFKDYVKFLQDNARYDGALNAPTYQEQIKAIAKAGYATDPNYSNVLLSIAARVDKVMESLGTFVKENKGKLITSAVCLTAAYIISKWKK
jgi:flagellar protein FlgJ